MPLERLEKVRIVNDEDEDDERASAPNRQHTQLQHVKPTTAPIYAPWPTHNKDFGEDSFIAMVFVEFKGSLRVYIEQAQYLFSQDIFEKARWVGEHVLQAAPQPTTANVKKTVNLLRYIRKRDNDGTACCCAQIGGWFLSYLLYYAGEARWERESFCWLSN